MSILIIGVAVALLLVFYNRLRLINWHTARPEFVALYLLQVLWTLSVLYDAMTDSVAWHQCIGILAQGVWAHVSRSSWAGGVPEHIKTQPAELGPPEVERV